MYAANTLPAVNERSYPQRDYSRPPEAIEILLARHGASQAVTAGESLELLEGQADPALAAEGRMQAHALALRLAEEPLDALYITPLRRTAETAAPLAAMTGLEPQVVPELREVHLGELDGGAFRVAVHEDDPRIPQVFAAERWDVISGAEPMEAFAARTRAGIERIVAASRPGASVVAVVHGGVIGELCRQASGSRAFAFVHADNGSITRMIVFPDGGWSVRSFNEGGHLLSLAKDLA